jgi:hypothetical protein
LRKEYGATGFREKFSNKEFSLMQEVCSQTKKDLYALRRKRSKKLSAKNVS